MFSYSSTPLSDLPTTVSAGDSMTVTDARDIYYDPFDTEIDVAVVRAVSAVASRSERCMLR